MGESIPVYDDFILHKDSRIHVLAYGIQELRELKECKDLIVIIPGNPGEIAFFEYFMELLYQQLGQQWVILGISHTGHSSYQVIKNTQQQIHEGSRRIFDLNDQIRFKLEFLDQYINRSARIIMIAHSIGAYISIEMLNQNQSLEKQVIKLICVFPTIERMKETSLGKLYSFVFDWLYYPVISLVHAIDLLVPQSARPTIVDYLLFGHPKLNKERKIPLCARKAALSIAKPTSVKNIVQMAYTEFQQVQQPNLMAILRLGDKITFLHGDQDGWAPLEYWAQLKESLPDCDIRLVLSGHEHAFTLHEDSTREISEIIIEILKPIVSK